VIGSAFFAKPSARTAVLLAAAVAVAGAWLATAEGTSELPWWRRYTPAEFAANAAASYLLLGGAFALWPGGRAEGIGRRALAFAVLTASSFLCLTLVEAPVVLLGHDYRRTLGTLGPEGELGVPIQANRLDPELIHIHHPNTAFRGRVRGNLTPMGSPGESYAVDVRYDANGFRNDRELVRADIAVIGDSFVEAALVPLAETLPMRLEQATGVATANLGQAAYGLQQELVVLRRFALPLSPSLVVWCFFGGNDLRDVEAYEEARANFHRLAELSKPSVVDRLFATNALRKARTILACSELSEVARKHSGIFTDAAGETSRVFFRAREGPWDDHSLAVARATLREASSLCTEAGAKLLVLYVPRKFRVYAEACRFEDDAVCRSWRSNDLPDVLARWCAENGIAFEDSTTALRERVARGEAVYFADDVHWNGAGHAVAAEVVLARSRREGWLVAGGDS
jgi:hypothetical protein